MSHSSGLVPAVKIFILKRHRELVRSLMIVELVCERRRAYSSLTRPTSLHSRRLHHSGRCPGYSDHTRTGTPPRCRWLPSHLRLPRKTHTHADVLNRCWKRWCSSWLSEALWSCNLSLLILSETTHEVTELSTKTVNMFTYYTLHALQTSVL